MKVELSIHPVHHGRLRRGGFHTAGVAVDIYVIGTADQILPWIFRISRRDAEVKQPAVFQFTCPIVYDLEE
jgi:hypothetical protein